MQSLELSDVEMIVQLVADAGDPTVDLSLADRKRRILEGIARFIQADVWIWSSAVPNPNVPGDAMATCLISGGWQEPQQEARVLELLSDLDFNRQTIGPIIQAVQQQRFATFQRKDLVDDEAWQQVGKTWSRTGLEHFLIVVYPLSESTYSAVGFHRRAGTSDFSARDRTIAHLVLQQVDWLHRHGSSTHAQSKVLKLSPRERQVLVLLLNGDTRKGIAAKLGISEFTVGDYMKQLHKHFSVNSRAELQAYFLAGGLPLEETAPPSESTT